MKIQFVTVNQNSFDKGDGVTRDMEYIPSLGGIWQSFGECKRQRPT